MRENRSAEILSSEAVEKYILLNTLDTMAMKVMHGTIIVDTLFNICFIFSGPQ